MSRSDAMARSSLRRHIPELDGVRGVAIAAVMALHFVNNMITPTNAVEVAAHKLTSYGVWGVDLFFVLSGFLITGILHDSKGGARYFKSFYMRRTLRIFPLYYGVLALVFLVLPRGFLAAHAPGLLEAREIQGWLWPYLSNFYLAGQGSFSIPYLSHFWTLAIEEHFYLFWPFVVGLLPRGAAMRACVFLGGFALVLRIALSVWGPNALYVQVLTPCRLDSLCTGAWFALWARGEGGVSMVATQARRWIWPALAGILLSSGWHVIDQRLDAFLLPLRTTLLSLFFGFFILLAAWGGGTPMLGVLLRARWLTLLGRYSYGLYVYQGIVAHLMLEQKTPTAMAEWLGASGLAVVVNALAGVIVSTVLAVLSYHLFELHFLRLKRLFEVGSRATKTNTEVAGQS